MQIVKWPYVDSTGECDVCGAMVREVGRANRETSTEPANLFWCAGCGQLYLQAVDAPTETKESE